jgi:hypothetical protein
MLFVLPGNEINARIPELADPFIVGNILETNMAETVAIVSSRYVIPYSVLLFGILSAGRAFLPSISAMLLPVATALAAKMALMSIQRYDIISSTQNELIVNYMIYLSVFAILAVVIHAADAIILRCRQGGVDPRG